MVAGADFVVDAVARLTTRSPALELGGILGADAALARQHAFAVGNDHLSPRSAVRIASFSVAAIFATL